MTHVSPWIALIVFLTCIGCGPQAPTTPPTSELQIKQVEEDLPVVERAEYVNWNQFPVGTMVKHVRETKSDVDKVIVTTISRLASKSPDKVVIETQITVDRGGEPLVNPSMELEFPASFRLPRNMDASKFALPAQDAKVAGEETVQFKGKDYAAVVYSWTGSSEAGPTENKMWFCQAIPGRVFRHEMSCSAFTTSENLIELEIPGS